MPLVERIAKSLTWAASPLGLFFWLCAVALVVWLLRRRVAARVIVLIALAELVGFSWWPVAERFAGPIEDMAVEQAEPPGTAQAPGRYDAIVVLGGAVEIWIIGKATVRMNAAPERVLNAAQAWRDGVAPKIVVAAGGYFADEEGMPVEADVIGKLLTKTLGLPADAVLLDRHSINTRENMTETVKLIGTGKRIALFTSALHMPRSMMEARDAGLLPTAFPSEFRARVGPRLPTEQWLPNANALKLSTDAAKEYLGMLQLKLWRR